MEEQKLTKAVQHFSAKDGGLNVKEIKSFLRENTKIKRSDINKSKREKLELLLKEYLSEKNIAIDQKETSKTIKLTDEIKHKTVGDYFSFYYLQTDKILSPAEQLEKIGAVCIPVVEEKELKNIQEEFQQTLQEFPEYLRHPDNPSLNIQGEPIVYVAGGFAALGNPASFHNPLVRKLRTSCYQKARPLLEKLLSHHFPEKQTEVRFHQLFDRMMFRRAGQKGPSESWHRDVMNPEQICEHDQIFGGWLNLDSTEQHFSFIPGSHLNEDLFRLDPGFAETESYLRKKYKQSYSGNLKDKEKEKFIRKAVKKDLKSISENKMRLTVPPGHLIIFYQYILHEIVAKAVKHDITRLFTGWRLTLGDKSVYLDSKKEDKIEDIFEIMAVPQLPGGDICTMYSKNHVRGFLRRPFYLVPGEVKKNLIDWSTSTFKEELQERKYSQTHEDWYNLIPRKLKSLQEYDMMIYPQYSEEEKRMYLPQKF